MTPERSVTCPDRPLCPDIDQVVYLREAGTDGSDLQVLQVSDKPQAVVWRACWSPPSVLHRGLGDQQDMKAKLESNQASAEVHDLRCHDAENVLVS